MTSSNSIGERAKSRCVFYVMTFPCGFSEIGNPLIDDQPTVGAVFFNAGALTLR